MKPVTDPNILAQLESGVQPEAPVGQVSPGMRPVTDPSVLAQLNDTPATVQTPPIMTPEMSPVTDPDILAQLDAGVSAPALEPQLRAKFQDPVQYPKLPENSDLDSLLGGATFDMRRRLAELPANIMDTSANKVDELANSAMNTFYSMFGPPEPLETTGPNVLQAPEGNFLSNALRSGADKLYGVANEQAGMRDAYNAKPSIQSWQEVKDAGADNEYLPAFMSEKLPRFIAEQGAASLPEMMAAMAPVIGLPTIASSMTERIAEDRAVNQGRGVRDVSGDDLAVAAMFGVPIAAAERIGVKGIVPKGILGGSARLGTGAATRVANTLKSGAKEASTEAIQEPAEMLGGAIGTDANPTARDYLDAAEAGAVVGGALGSGARGTFETFDATRQALKGKKGVEIETQPAQDAPPNPMEEPVRTAAPSEPVAAPVQPPPPPAAPPQMGSLVVQTAAQPGGQPAAQPAVQTPARKKLVTPNNSMEIEAEDQIIELDDLRTSDAPDYPASRQPRDRSSKRSEAQLTEIFKNFDPERLVDSSRTTDAGAPIIGPEGENFVESGNGRVMTLRRVYSEDPTKAQAYKDALAKAGYDVSKFKNPVLVRRRRTELDEAGVSRFVEDSNRPTMMAQNETEIAKQDARRLTPDMIGMYKGGSLLSETNADFRNRFIKEVVGSEGEAAGLRDKNGNLSQSGERRVRAAIFQYAYNNDQAVENFFTSADPDLKSIGDVMQDVAPAYAGVRSNVQARGLDSGYDISKNITDALDMIRAAREGGRTIEDQINQRDMFGGGEVDPVTEKIVRGLYNKDLSRIASKKAIDNFLRSYADKVRSYDPNQGDMLGGAQLPKPAQLLEDLLAARDGREAQPVQGTLAGTQAPSVKPKTGTPEPGSAPTEKKKPAPLPPLGIKRTDVNLLQEQDAEYINTELWKDWQDQLKERIGTPAEEKTDAGDIEYIEKLLNKVERLKGLRQKREDLKKEEAAGSAEMDMAPEKNAAPAPAQTKKTGGVVAGRNARFEKEAFTENTSYARNVFVDAGYDPDVASNLPPQRKFQIIKEQIKKKYDIDIDMEGGIPILNAIDQGVELYRNLDVMAYELQMTPKSMGLNLKEGKNIKSSLRLKFIDKLRGALGVYYPGEKKIALPRRSNSFAHEWGHALDYKILEMLDIDGLASKFRGFTDKVRKVGLGSFEPDSVSEAWVNLMGALFFDKAAVAAEISLLEQKLERARSEKSKAEIQAEIDALKDGTSGKLKVRTDFYKRASAANKMSGGDYWTRPTEMFARAVEAYIANRVAARGGYTTVLSKNDAAYENSIDPEFQLRYPRLEERLAIFDAFDKLFDAMRREDVLGQADFDPTKIPDPEGHILDMIETVRPTRTVSKGMIQRMRDAYKKEVGGFKTDLARRKAASARPDSPRTVRQMVRSTLEAAFKAERAVIRGMINRYPGSKALVELRNRFTSAPGEGGNFTRGYNDTVSRLGTIYLNKIFRALDTSGVDMNNAANQDAVRDILLGNDPKNVTPAQRKAAAMIRKVLDEIWTYADKNGLKIGYVRDKGYFPRLLDTVLVKDGKSHEAFVKDAIKLYGAMFEHEVGTFEDLKIGAFLEFIRDEGNLAILRRSEKANIKKLAGMVDRLNSETDAAKKDQLKQEISQFLQDTDLYNLVKEEYTENAARAWLGRIITGNDAENLGFNAPSGTFKKARTLPGQADDIMKNWYLRNPEEVLTQYVRGVVRQVEWDKRAKPNGGKSIDDLISQMKKQEGVQEEDADIVRDLIYNMSGRDPGTGYANKDVSRLMSYAHMLGTMTMLTKAAIMSIPEPLVVGLRTGNFGDSVKVFYYAMKDIIGTADAQDVKDIVEFAGIYVSNSAYDQTVQNRMGGIFNDSPNIEAKLSRFFQRSGLTPLTTASRRWVAKVHMGYINRMSQKLMDKNYKHQKMLQKDFQEMGIPMDKQEQFAEFVASFGANGPKVEDLVGDANSGYAPTEMGELYMEAMYNLSVNTVMDPNPEDRPRWANTPVGRVVYSITGFLYAFYERVVKRNAKRIREAHQTEGFAYATGEAAALALTFAPLAAAHMALFALRTAIFNPDRDDEWIEKGEYFKKVTLGGLSNTGIMGPWDILFNAVYGLRYQRDLSNSFLGAHAGYTVQGVEDIFGAFIMNSEKTNTAEFKALSGLYALTLAPASGYLMATLPGGPLLGHAYGAGAAYLTSTAAKGDFAETVIGPKGSKTTSNFQYSDEEKKSKKGFEFSSPKIKM